MGETLVHRTDHARVIRNWHWARHSGNGCSMWRCIFVLEDKPVILNSWNDYLKKDLILISLARHLSFDNAQRTSFTMPDSRPNENIPTSVLIVFTDSGRCKSLSFKSMDVDATIMEIKDGSWFVFQHHLISLILSSLGSVWTPFLRSPFEACLPRNSVSRMIASNVCFH